MKHFLLSVYFLFCLILSNNAQNNVSPHFVFADFKEATVHYKNGNISKTNLNYNKATEEMIYVANNGQNMALYPTDQIDVIYIEGRKFIPVDNAFYEIIKDGDILLCAAYKCRTSLISSNVGYGSSSTTATENITSLRNAGEIYQLKLSDKFKISPFTLYYIKSGDEFYKLSKIKDYVKVFPQFQDEINAYIKMHKLKNNLDDYISITDQVNSLLVK